MGDTYPLVPNRISEFEIEFKTSEVKFENGWEQRSANWDEGQEGFTLEHYFLGKEEADILSSFFREKRGKFRKFYFKNYIDGKTYQVRFAEDKLHFEPLKARFFSTKVKLVKAC
ncbi:DUF2460 domain-containing protein [Desulfoluna butyratoxydans]|uniref:DUF2460 domain-containing protein n=1 Tax=Desulfoluna butyratoxydans TaxID=231438 RepID=A0A4U8YK92_9BACT|nr:DUF2460 domain-containing protein [Desulfoluna butyratoxydans]VFQ43857.1 protein of unknown function duf2460 [Desulfoluna butyratoxydans]